MPFQMGFFRTVVQQLRRYQLTYRIARSLCNPIAELLVIIYLFIFTSRALGNIRPIQLRVDSSVMTCTVTAELTNRVEQIHADTTHFVTFHVFRERDVDCTGSVEHRRRAPFLDSSSTCFRVQTPIHMIRTQLL